MKNDSREKILSRVKQNQPSKSPLPEIPTFEEEGLDLITTFEKSVTASAGKVLQLENGENLNDLIATGFPKADKIVSLSDKIDGNFQLDHYTHPVELHDIDVVILEGEMGVAENGAVWVRESKMGQRVLPFITQHLVVLVKQGKLLPNMTEAYRNIKIEEDGFGVFIAGPSKTADIEQSLVIGAQGARSFTVVLLE